MQNSNKSNNSFLETLNILSKKVQNHFIEDSSLVYLKNYFDNNFFFKL